MRIYFGNLYVTEVCREGLELSYEFECGHCESSEFLLDLLTSHFKSLNLEFINLYYDGSIDNYLINLKSINNKLISERLDLSLFSDLDLIKLKNDFRMVI